MTPSVTEGIAVDFVMRENDTSAGGVSTAERDVTASVTMGISVDVVVKVNVVKASDTKVVVTDVVNRVVSSEALRWRYFEEPEENVETACAKPVALPGMSAVEHKEGLLSSLCDNDTEKTEDMPLESVDAFVFFRMTYSCFERTLLRCSCAIAEAGGSHARNAMLPQIVH